MVDCVSISRAKGLERPLKASHVEGVCMTENSNRNWCDTFEFTLGRCNTLEFTLEWCGTLESTLEC
eukprot:365323-Chlamydomonas_euryale.AAC.18